MVAERPTLYVLCGLPGSGKSRYAERLRERESPHALILSSDDVRWTFSGHLDAEYRSGAERWLWQVIEAYAHGCLTYKRSVIIDATNLTWARRRSLRTLGHGHGATVECHYIKCPTKESIRRSAKWISARDIESLAEDLQEPSLDEGWNRLVVTDA